MTKTAEDDLEEIEEMETTEATKKRKKRKRSALVHEDDLDDDNIRKSEFIISALLSSECRTQSLYHHVFDTDTVQRTMAQIPVVV